MEVRQTWTDFKERTAIHGFTEYSGLGRKAKVIWIVFVAVVLIFCASQLNVLFDAFLDKTETTLVSTATTVALPDVRITIGFNEIMMQYGQKADDVNDTESYVNYMINAKEMQETGDRGCPMPPDWYPKLTTHSLGEITGRDLLDAFEGHISFNATDAITEVMMGKLSADGDTLDLIEEKRHTIQPQLSMYGPSLLVGTSMYNTSTVNGIHMNFSRTLKMAEGKRYPVYLHIGSHARKIDTPLSMALTLGTYGMSYKVRATLTVYGRASSICSKEETYSHLSCTSKCMLDQLGCTAWFGSAEKSLDLPVCMPKDSSRCAIAAQECANYCEKCRSCKLCHQVIAHVTKEAAWHPGDGPDMYPGLDVDFASGLIVTFHAKPQYTVTAIFSQVGGILGLCFGVSIISVGHSLCFLFTASKAIISAHLGKREN